MFEGLRFQHWQSSLDEDGIVTLTLDRAGRSANALSREVMDELAEIVERLSFEPPRGVVIRSGKRGFIVGADLTEFEQYARDGRVQDVLENGQRVLQKLAQLPCPTVAAIHGACMGGGTEMALACRYRVASRDPSTRIGLPEVKLGIFPGWGGSARLPRLIGAPAALELMLTGRAASAENCRKLGLVDRLADADRLLQTARELITRPPHRSLRQRATAWASNTWPARQVLAELMLKQTAAKVRKQHYPAPFALIDTWRRGGARLSQRLKLEARAVAKLAATPTARQLVRVFFLQERLKSLGKDAEHGIHHVHVVGAGVMGGDIAAWCALREFQVTLQDREMKYVQPALERARTLFTRRLKTPERIDAALARLRADVEGSGIAAADLLIEAIYENGEAKEALYRDAEPKLKADALLATNTSSIPLDELRQAVAQPGRFLGLHYFNPVALMPLVEVVRHDRLADASEKRALAFCRAIGKLPLAVAGTPGFLVNRILMPYMLEAARAFSEGIPGPVIDKAARHFGMPMGPIELIDTVGLDVAASVGAVLGPFLELEIPPALEELVQGGKRGKKDGQGFYKWEDGKPQKPAVDPADQAPADLEDRLILPLLNEAVACLHDRVVDDADLLDAGVIFGTGFAPFRGGPIQYIRDTGTAALQARLETLTRTYGPRFAPRPGWDAPELTAPA
ncbi:3-hydroxyacyl-CoA dehydrogenase NAD-binding domain-containing protein [Dokdonella sp.]|uniref:3-hydroxyacyl-CoA dehydrogenase NAD-binding domain-containing protein n=1 Tax=Dokdonella sp. TaxID=2291710 RepID=UPI0031C871B4|nr:3-hydroxyacyl-CoA dehydrogenase NAD-binding domain-containing protein [Dokdonella sp.]